MAHIGYQQIKLCSIYGEVSLYKVDSPFLKIDISLRFEGETLVLEGYDRGVTTKQMAGADDYEYRITILGDAVAALCSWLNTAPAQKQMLLKAVAARISGEKAYTLFRDMLGEAAVAFEPRSW